MRNTSGMEEFSWVLVTIFLTFNIGAGPCNAWFLPPKPVCPLGYVEVRGCVPVENMDHGAIRPFGPARPPAPPPSPASPPPPPSCPAGFKWSNTFGGCAFDKKPAAPKPKSPTSPPPSEDTPAEEKRPA